MPQNNLLHSSFFKIIGWTSLNCITLHRTNQSDESMKFSSTTRARPVVHFTFHAGSRLSRISSGNHGNLRCRVWEGKTKDSFSFNCFFDHPTNSNWHRPSKRLVIRVGSAGSFRGVSYTAPRFPSVCPHVLPCFAMFCSIPMGEGHNMPCPIFLPWRCATVSLDCRVVCRKETRSCPTARIDHKIKH